MVESSMMTSRFYVNSSRLKVVIMLGQPLRNDNLIAAGDPQAQLAATAGLRTVESMLGWVCEQLEDDVPANLHRRFTRNSRSYEIAMRLLRLTQGMCGVFLQLWPFHRLSNFQQILRVLRSQCCCMDAVDSVQEMDMACSDSSCGNDS